MIGTHFQTPKGHGRKLKKKPAYRATIWTEHSRHFIYAEVKIQPKLRHMPVTCCWRKHTDPRKGHVSDDLRSALWPVSASGLCCSTWWHTSWSCHCTASDGFWENLTVRPNNVFHFAEGDQQGGCQVRSLAWRVKHAMKVFAYICVVLRSR